MTPVIFFIVNGIIGLCYGLIAIFFAKRVRWPRHRVRHGWRVAITLIFAAMFFIGCAHTHFELAWLATQGDLNEHWLHWPTTISHALQAIGGIGFYILANKWVQLSIFDKKDYESTILETENGF